MEFHPRLSTPTLQFHCPGEGGMDLYTILYSNIQQLLDIMIGIGEARSNKLDLQPPQMEDSNEGEPASDRNSKERSSDEDR